MKIFVFFLIFFQIGQVFALSFSDTSYSFYRDSIETLSNEGIISGFGDGTFGPEKTISRAELLKIFLKAKGTPIDTRDKTRCFPDVAVNMWYSAYICEAVKLGVVK